MSPRPSSTIKVSPYLSVRGGREGCAAVIVNASGGVSAAGAVGKTAPATAFKPDFAAAAFRLAVNVIGIAAYELLSCYGFALP
jgi:hypothetical protein